jgi:hypothetical protein
MIQPFVKQFDIAIIIRRRNAPSMASSGLGHATLGSVGLSGDTPGQRE